MNNQIKFYQSIKFKIALVFALVLLLTIEIVGAVFIRQLEHQNLTTFKNQIQLQTYVTNSLTNELSKTNLKESNKEIKTILSDSNTNSNAQIQVIDNKGTIRGTNEINNQAIVGQKTTDNSIKTAIYNNRTIEKNTYDSQSNDRYYTEIKPLIKSFGNNNEVVGAVYIKANLDAVYRNISSITVIYLSAAVIAMILGLLIAIVISRAITNPIEEMRKQTMRIARGDYSGQVHVYGTDELGQLASAVNNLSVRVEQSHESTESERRRLDSVLANMTDGVIATDRRGNVIIVNEMARIFLDSTDDELIGKSLLDVIDIHDKYSLRDLLEGMQEFVVDLSDEGHELIVHAHVSLIQRESGFISGLVCVLHDITEQQKIDADRRQFVSNVSHELRTPLTSVRSYIEALTDGAWKDPKLAPKFLKVTEDETDRMIRMINDLLTLSRMDSGTQTINSELVNINELFNYILNRFDMILEKDDNPEKTYTIKREFTKRDLWVDLDTDRFTQVLDNLMNNAIKYSPDGGVITCRLYETRNKVIISVSDQGLGIPRKDIPHIFDRFYRVDKARSRQQGGSGLGLAISKEVVEASNGQIWAESVEGRGSTFYIALPYEPLAEEDLWDEI